MSLSLLSEAEGRWQQSVVSGTLEQPLPEELEQLKEFVAYRVIGPTGGRSKVIKEEQTEVQLEIPATKPGVKHHVRREFHVQQTVETASVELLARQPEWSAPCWKNTCSEAIAAGVNIEQLLVGADAGADVPLVNQAQLEELLAAAKAQQSQLFNSTMARLAAKLLNQSENKQLQLALMAEGAAGLWDLTTGRQQQTGSITPGALRGLMTAVRKPILSAKLHMPAVCAVWQACITAKARERLIKSGVVEVLLHIADSAFSHIRTTSFKQLVTVSNSSAAGHQCSSKEFSALLAASLGALAVLMVDSQARQSLLSNKLGLRLLAEVAGMPDHELKLPAEDAQQCQLLSEQPVLNVAADPAQALAAAEAASHSPAPAPLIPALQCAAADTVAETKSHSAAAAASETTFLDVSDPGVKGAEDADSTLNSNHRTAEEPVIIPTALMALNPNQMAAEVLGAVLLRDPAARMAFLENGSCHLLLFLTGASDPAVQLCGAAAVASMAATVYQTDGSTASLSTKPQLLWDMYGSLQHVLCQAAHRQHQHQQQGAAVKSAADSNDQHNGELDAMLLEYGSLALWVVISALAPSFSKSQVFPQLIAAGQLAKDCMSLGHAASTSHAVIVCMSATLCTILSSQAAAAAASDAEVPISPAEVVQAVQPAVSAVLLLEAAGPEVTQAKLLAAVMVMLLAGFERSDKEQQCSSSFSSQLLCSTSLINAGQQQHCEVNPHPPFRGVFRDALHERGLLPAMLGLVMHSSGTNTADCEEHVLTSNTTDDRSAVNHFTPPCSTPLLDDGQGTKALVEQVVAAACQLLVAVNQPLPPTSCAQVLDFLWNQITHQQTVAAATAAAAAQTSPAIADGKHTNREGQTNAINRVYVPGALYYAVTMWCLSQHEQQQQVLLLDGRWSQLLHWLVTPALLRIKRAIAAGTRRTASAIGYDESAALGSSLVSATVPRLQLQALQQPGSGTSAAASPPQVASNNTNKRAVEAAGVVRLCLQCCWLLLQQQARLRLLATELPADLRAVYAKGTCSYWAMKINAPSPPELLAPVKSGLSLLVHALDLPDSWEVALKLKALALKCCWCLSGADKGMHTHLVELGLPQCTGTACQNAAVFYSSRHRDHPDNHTGTVSAADELLMSAAGYLTAVVQDDVALQALGGEQATVQLLVSLLTTCTVRSIPAGVNITLLATLLSSLAWLSSKKDAATACCSGEVVAALLDVLRLEKQAYKALEALARDHSSGNGEPQHQKPRQPVVKFQRGFTQSGSGGTPLNAGPSAAIPVAQPSSSWKAHKQQQQTPLSPLPSSVIKAPFASLQQPTAWIEAWLQSQQQKQQQSQSGKAPSSPCAASKHSSRPGSPQQHTALNKCASGRQQATSPQCSPQSTERAELVRCRPASAACIGPGSAAGGQPSSRQSTARPASAGPYSSRAGIPSSSRSAATSSCTFWNDVGSTCDSQQVEYQEVSTPDGTEGMLALWALLNLSVHHAGQVWICKKGLYTLIMLVQDCPDPQRVSVAAAILENLTNAKENTALIYKAELRLKHAALLRQAGIQRVLTNPSRDREVNCGSTREPPTASDGSGTQPQEMLLQGELLAPATAQTGKRSLAQTARRASALEIAAESGVLTSILCTTHRGVPKGGISSEEHQAGVLLSRVSELTSRSVVPVFRPNKSFSRAAGPGSASTSVDGGQVARREGYSSTAGGFGTAVTELIPAAAGMATSRYSTPRAGEGFFMESGAAAAGAGTTGAAAGAGGTDAVAPNTQEVKAAFMRWLQEAMPEAVGPASSPTTPGPATRANSAKTETTGRVSPSQDNIKGLAEEADLAHISTEDMEEDDWLEQQRLAQKLHEFYTARAAQGQLLRGSLASSLRASASTLWDRNQDATSVRQACKPGTCLPQQAGGVCELMRPQSAPPGGRRNPARSKHTCSSVVNTANGSRAQHAATDHSNSRPATPRGRPASPVIRATLQGQDHGRSGLASPDSRCNAFVDDSKGAGSRRRPHSAFTRTVDDAIRPAILVLGKDTCLDPWAPAVVAYVQLPGANITKPWQAVNQLLVARPEEDIVQQLAAAATRVLDGHLPKDSPQDVLITSLHHKETLEQIMQQCQLHEQQQQPQAQVLYVPQAQQRARPSTEQCAAAMLSEDAWHGICSDSAAADHVHQCSTEQGDSVGQEVLDSQQYCQEHITRGSEGSPSLVLTAEDFSRGTPATDRQPTGLGQPDGLRVTWGAGTSGGNADGLSTDTASSMPGDAGAGLSTRWQDLRIASDDALLGANLAGQCSCSTTSQTAGAQEDLLLLQRPKTAYAVPNYGSLHGKQYIPELRGTFSSAVADSLRKHKQERSTVVAGGKLQTARPTLGIPTRIPKPLTVMDVTSEPAARRVKMLVRSIDDTNLPHRGFDFHKRDPPADPALAMHVFEHVDGAQFCSTLYGHYLLPSGKMAHFFVPPAACKQGHTITMPPPPITPWDALEWLPDGLPPAPAAELLLSYLRPELAMVQLPQVRGLNWVPVPQLAPQPCTCSLSATRDAFGHLTLQPGPMRLKVIVHKTLEQREFRKPMSAKAAGERRRSSTMGAAKPPQQQPAVVEKLKAVSTAGSKGT